MPASDILNPTRGWDVTLGDSMNPSYVVTRTRESTLLSKKPVGGVPTTRETQNTGHTFSMGWQGRTWACVQRLKWYYEQYERGFFTIIDWEGGGRQYVGHFTSAPQEKRTANNKFDVENVTFEEIPTVAMLEYPSDWAHEAIALFVNSDYGDQDLAVSGTWAQTARASVAGTASTEHVDLSTVGTAYTTMDDSSQTAGDWACYEYKGYGFRLYLRKGPDCGNVNLYVDGVLAETIDCFAAADQGPQIVATYQSLALDFHRVKIILDSVTMQPQPVTDKAPTLASMAGTLSVAKANDILGGSLAITNALGAASTLTLGTYPTSDTLAHLAATINAAGYGIAATVAGASMTFAENNQAAIVGSDLTDTTVAAVVETAPTLASIAGTLTVSAATDVLGGTLAITNALGVASTLTLGREGGTDTLANLQTAINAANYGITATITGGTAMTFAKTAVAAVVGSNLTDTTPGIDGTLTTLEGALTITDSTGAAHAVTLGAAGTTDTLAHLLTYFNVTKAAWGITATISGTSMTFAGSNSRCNVVGSFPTGASWYALEVMR